MMSELKIYSKKRLLVAGLMIGIGVTLAIFVLFRKGGFDFLEQKSIDWRFLTRGEIEADPRIVIVTIDESSFSEFNQKWPWPRTYFARLIERLSSEGAKVVGIDVIMSEPYGRDQDEQLARSAKASGNVILPSKFEEMTRRIKWQGKEVELKEEVLKGPIEVISATADSGFLNLPRDTDGFVRRFTPIRFYREQLYASFGLKIAMRFLEVPVGDLKVAPYEELRVGDRVVPLNRYNSAHINFAGPAGKFQRVSFHEVLNGQYPKGFFEGKVVLVGATYLDSHDFFPTPFMVDDEGRKHPLPGVEIHANVINTILQKRFIRPSPYLFDSLFILLGGLLITILSLRLSLMKGVFFVSFLIFGYLAGSVWLFSRDILLVTTAPIVTLAAVFLSEVVFKYFTEEREKRRVRSIFQKYVSPDVVERLIQDPKQLQLGGEERVLTVLFCDLASFTTYSEQHSPSEMVDLLSEYFTDMTAQIFDHHGMLKEYVGDELMAIFGAPVEQPDHAVRACGAALAMKERLRLLRQAWTEMGRPPLRARTGINSGPMLVGNMGSAYRFSYGVLGDHVNLASRLEGLNKAYGTEIMIGENTARMLNGAFILRELDWVRVKGREQMISIFELVAKSEAPLPMDLEGTLKHYAKGLAAYRQRDWETALGRFRRAVELSPEDGPSKAMTTRCEAYLESPPEEDWDGVFQQTTK